MNEEYVVDVEDLTIRFNLASEKVDNLKEYVIKMIKHELMFQEFLALKHVNLKVKSGEAWGLIGTNGSGKSTLLKACCGILKPYTGTVTTRGKIAPLIELGAGFDMNMTARENVFLNGTVLGHSRKFMEEHFNEIIDFAELQDFLDVPIKNFSSGMQARLGFAIATMVRPDILVVDEILSVGDQHFQEKCINKMKQLKEEGKTMVFVTHSLDSAKELCDRAVWLCNGVLKLDGKTNEVIEKYIEETA